ncbi:MAG TPA: DUF4412 domain-containing protein [Cyclobacteriaceae bacterium]|nr:DUF4412 domain-containing protein [Cyclobacteriaceae bacterium]
MKSFLTVCILLFSFACVAQNFEGTIKWSMKSEITDPKMKAQMEEAQQKMNDPASQAQMKEMKEKMNSPEMKAMMEQNPQMKQQMEEAMKMMQGGDMSSMMPTGFVVKIKNSNTLSVMEGGMMAGTETLYLKEKNQTYLINQSNKTYTVFSNTGGGSNPHGEVKVNKTSETQKILNYTCTKTIVTVTDKGKSIEQIFWTTQDIKDFDLKSLAKQRMDSGQSMFYENIEGVPLKMEMTTPEAKMIMQVTEIKKETLPSSMFAVPAGFTETKLPGQH